MDNILEIKDVSIEYQNLKDNKSITRAVKNISLNIQKGEIYALAGESGCGKSTLAKAIMKLIKPKHGDIFFDKQNIKELDSKKYPQLIQMIFQNPYSSLNPKMKIKEILQEPLDINTKYSKNRKNLIIKETLKEVGLKESCLDLYPHEFSGGQRQRIAIARALVLNPPFIIADEPVSALDASIQAQIINLLKDLKKQRNLTILFISHDLNVIRYLADKVGIMCFGELIEENNTLKIFNSPQSEYTKILLNSSPKLQY